MCAVAHRKNFFGSYNFLQKFFERNKYVISEYDYDVDIAVQREEASHQKALQDAKNLKRLGVSISIITESTGLTREEVETL